MSIPLKDLKILWGRAAGHCSICSVKLSEDKVSVNAAFPLGEQAHIVSEEASGPRGKSILSVEERNSYSNLILLCPNCHTRIDKAPEDYPVEKLHLLKTAHELKVQHQITGFTEDSTAVEAVAYAQWIEKTTEAFKLKEWERWYSFACSCDPRWGWDFVQQVEFFQREVAAAVWLGRNLELERAITTLSLAFHRAFKIFFRHATSEGSLVGYYSAVRYYRYARNGEEDYQRLLEDYEDWINSYYRAVDDLVRAANWFAAVVRRDFDPKFLVGQGHFLNDRYFSVEMSQAAFSNTHQFTDEKKSLLPDAWLQGDMGK